MMILCNSCDSCDLRCGSDCFTMSMYLPLSLRGVFAAETTHCEQPPNQSNQFSGALVPFNQIKSILQGIRTLQSNQFSGGIGTPNTFAMFLASSLEERNRFIIGVGQHRKQCVCHSVCVSAEMECEEFATQNRNEYSE